MVNFKPQRGLVILSNLFNLCLSPTMRRTDKRNINELIENSMKKEVPCVRTYLLEQSFSTKFPQ